MGMATRLWTILYSMVTFVLDILHSDVAPFRDSLCNFVGRGPIQESCTLVWV